MNQGFEQLSCVSMGGWNFDWQVESWDRTTYESVGAGGVVKDYKEKVGHEPHALVRIETKTTYGQRELVQNLTRC